MQRIDISEFGSDVYSVTGVGGILYFAPIVNSQDAFNQMVYAYNISTEEISAIKFPEGVFHVVNMDDKLYVTHGNLVTGEGTALSVYTIGTGEISTYDLNMWPGQITIENNGLYVMGTDTVAKFDLQTMDKQAEISIPLNEGYYLSSIFSNWNNDCLSYGNEKQMKNSLKEYLIVLKNSTNPKIIELDKGK